MRTPIGRTRFHGIIVFASPFLALSACSSGIPQPSGVSLQERAYVIRGVDNEGRNVAPLATTALLSESATPALRRGAGDAFRRNPALEYAGEPIEMLVAEADKLREPIGLSVAETEKAAIAAYKLGVAYMEGLAVDDGGAGGASRAAIYLSLAANAGRLREARYDLSTVLLSNQSDPYESRREALRNLKLAAIPEQTGYPPALYRLGMAYLGPQNGADPFSGQPDLTGLVRRDPRRAAELIEAAGGRGVPEAQFQIGKMYLAGIGVGQNVDKGIRLTREAAGRGIVDAQRTLGILYMDGCGPIGQDFNEAQRRLTDAANAGDELASALLDELEAQRPVPVTPFFLGNQDCMVVASQKTATLVDRMQTARAAGLGVTNVEETALICTPPGYGDRSSIKGRPSGRIRPVGETGDGRGAIVEYVVQTPEGERVERKTVPLTPDL